jgi:lipopolysaccharide export system permease protein
MSSEAADVATVDSLQQTVIEADSSAGFMKTTLRSSVGKYRPLKSKLNVLENFNASEKIRIYESAMNNLRANKSTVDYSMQNFMQDQERINRHDIEWHRKFTLSFACMILFLIGAPLGAIIRKGGLGMPVVFSLVLFIIYHMIYITGEKLAREGVLTPFWGMWMSSAVLLPMGLFLSYKAATDSALFDRDLYIRFFKRLMFFRRKG